MNADQRGTVVATYGPVSTGNGTITRMYPYYFESGMDADAQHAGVERIDGADYFFGDIDVALAAFRTYLEGLPRRDDLTLQKGVTENGDKR